jgi:hypothetical protein
MALKARARITAIFVTAISALHIRDCHHVLELFGRARLKNKTTKLVA